MRLAPWIAAAFLAAPLAALAQSPWPVITADPALVEEIREQVNPFYSLGPYDLTVIPPADEPAARAAWLDTRYGDWLQLAASFDRSRRQTAEIFRSGQRTTGRAPDPQLDADLARLVAETDREIEALASIVPLAEAARAAVAEAERLRVEAAAGRATQAQLNAAIARRDAAETAFRAADRDHGLTADTHEDLRERDAMTMLRVYEAQDAFRIDSQRQELAASIAAIRANLSGEELAEAERLYAEALVALERWAQATTVHSAARRRETQATLPADLVRDQSQMFVYRLVRDAVERGRLPPAALEAETERLRTTQERYWDMREEMYQARVAQEEAMRARNAARERASEARLLFSRYATYARSLAQSRAAATDPNSGWRLAAERRLAEAEALYEEVKAPGTLTPEALAGFYRRVENAREALENGPPGPRPLPPPAALRAQARPSDPRPEPPARVIPRPVRPDVLPRLPPPGLGVDRPTFAVSGASA